MTIDRKDHELDVVVASAEDPAVPPSEHSVRAIGEAKASETVGTEHLRVLENARAALGTRAAQARLLLFAPGFAAGLRDEAAGRPDLELVDLERLYRGTDSPDPELL